MSVATESAPKLKTSQLFDRLRHNYFPMHSYFVSRPLLSACYHIHALVFDHKLPGLKLEVVQNPHENENSPWREWNVTVMTSSEATLTPSIPADNVTCRSNSLISPGFLVFLSKLPQFFLTGKNVKSFFRNSRVAGNLGPCRVHCLVKRLSRHWAFLNHNTWLKKTKQNIRNESDAP